MGVLSSLDPEVDAAIIGEERRQKDSIILIASENYTSQAVKEAQGSSFTEKYAEGYPGRRYYSGCEYADVIEILARDRLNKLFGSAHANVQPHSGVQANSAVYFAYLKPGDTVLGMRLDHGGHLSHGSPVSFTGQYYNFISYGVREDTELIDYDQVEDLAKQHQPKIIIAGASAYPREINFAKFREIADKVGAILMADVAHYAGLIAAGVYADPVPHAQIITSTTQKTLRGPRGAFILTDEEHSKAIDKSVFPGAQGGPMMHTIAAKAVCFNEALQPRFKDYQKSVIQNSRAIADELQKAGMRIVSQGTDSHLLLVDVTSLGSTGRDSTKALESVGISVNANTIPFDKLPPMIGSGIRIGTPAITSRGFGEDDARNVARMIAKVLQNLDNEEILNSVRSDVMDLTQTFPVPGIDS